MFLHCAAGERCTWMGLGLAHSFDPAGARAALVKLAGPSLVCLAHFGAHDGTPGRGLKKGVGQRQMAMATRIENTRRVGVHDGNRKSPGPTHEHQAFLGSCASPALTATPSGPRQCPYLTASTPGSCCSRSLHRSEPESWALATWCGRCPRCSVPPLLAGWCSDGSHRR